MSKRIFGLVGLPAAGKQEVLNIIASQYGGDVCTMSNILREAGDHWDIPPERKYLSLIAAGLRDMHGQPILGALALDKLLSIDSKIGVIDGLRHPSDVQYLKENGVVILGVQASEEIRFERMKSRERPGDPQTFEEFLVLDRVERGVDVTDPSLNSIDQCMDLADRYITNESSVEDLGLQLRTIVEGNTLHAEGQGYSLSAERY